MKVELRGRKKELKAQRKRSKQRKFDPTKTPTVTLQKSTGCQLDISPITDIQTPGTAIPQTLSRLVEYTAAAQ